MSFVPENFSFMVYKIDFVYPPRSFEWSAATQNNDFGSASNFFLIRIPDRL